MIVCKLCGMKFWREHVVLTTMAGMKCFVCTLCYNKYFKPLGR